MENNKLRKLQWKSDGSWLIRQRNVNYAANMLPGSVVTACFASLNFKLENSKTLNVFVFKDNINAEKFRQLRVRLKVEGIKSNKSILEGHD